MKNIENVWFLGSSMFDMENVPFSSMIDDDLPKKKMVTFQEAPLPEAADDAWRFHFTIMMLHAGCQSIMAIAPCSLSNCTDCIHTWCQLAGIALSFKSWFHQKS